MCIYVWHSVHTRWTNKNRKIVPSEIQTTYSDLNKKILADYELQDDVQDIFTQDTIGARKSLNENNFVHFMHALLRMEELTRARIIARFDRGRAIYDIYTYVKSILK